MNNVRVRIAPSPTGDPHVGTAYIALFNLSSLAVLEENSFFASKTPTGHAHALNMRPAFSKR